MKELFQSKLNEFRKAYDGMPKSKKGLIIGSIYLASIVIILEIFLLQSLDSYKTAVERIEKLEGQKATFLKERNAILLQNSYKTDASLLKKKIELLKEIEQLMKLNENYISSHKVGQLIEKVVGSINKVSIVSFQNLPEDSLAKEDVDISSVLVQHNFNLRINGSFQGIYELLIRLETIKGINVSVVEIVKEKEGELIASISFYVVNTDKNILNF